LQLLVTMNVFFKIRQPFAGTIPFRNINGEIAGHWNKPLYIAMYELFQND